MKSLKLIKELEKYPVFDLRILNRIINKKKGYARLAMHRLSRNKFIFKIEKDKYTICPDPLIISSNIVWPCYLSCWTALRYHNLTEQLPDKIFVVTPRSRKNNRLKFMDYEIIFIKVRQKHFFGYKKELYKNFNVFIAEPEKAIIDSVLLKKISFSEIIDIITTHKDELNFNVIISYLLRIKNRALIKRFGFLLDRLNIKTVKKLKKFIDKKYVPLDYAKEKMGVKNDSWRVIENVKFA